MNSSEHPRTRRGTSSAVGGVFLLLAFIVLASFMIFTIRKYGELSASLIQILREHSRPEELSLRVVYTYTENPSASEVLEYSVVLGSYEEYGSKPLDEAGDGSYVEITSQRTLNVTSSAASQEELIENGEFTGTLDPWEVVNGKGSWSSSPYNSDWGALYSVSLGRAESDYALIRQEFSVSDSPKSITLSFRYNLTAQGFVGEYKLTLKILDAGDNVVYSKSYKWNTTIDGNWRSESIDLTSYLSTGNYTIVFEVSMSATIGWGADFYTWIDKVSILATYETASAEALPVYEAAVVFSISSEGTNTSMRLYMYTNTSVSLRVYKWLSDDNVWILTNAYLSEGSGWLWIDLESEKSRLYMYSGSAFKVLLDYANISTELLNKSGFYVILENTGSSISRIVSIWVNETRYPDTGVMNIYLLPTEETRISIGHELDYNKTYQVTVVTNEIKVVKIFNT